MKYDKDKFTDGENGTLSVDDRKVAEMLGNLRIIGAPKDFDHRLKARIANASPSAHTAGRFFPVLRYVMPLALFLLIGGAFIWNSALNGGQNGVTPIAETVQPVIPATIARPAIIENKSVETATSAAPPQSENFSPAKIEVTAVRQPKASSRKVETVSENGISSVDRALKQAPKTILPRGFDPEPIVANVVPPGPENKKQFTVREFLAAIGIDAVFAGSFWKVGSVVKNSPADNAGLRTGDLIESIDGRTADEQTVFADGFKAKTIKIVRESKTLVIDLKY
ncbi:MAG: hypothetical protein H7070_06915 [Saprospiraceae bacterium]|nr:hypothetical protein [Pyrinomonadaceae bacterium]